MRKIIIVRFAVLLLVIIAGSNTVAAQYNPDNPPEPAVRYKVKVKVFPEGAGYASGAGSFMAGQSSYISTSGVNGYDFLYWTKNGEKYQTNMSFNYTVESENADFVAVYQYNPANPDEPVANQAYRLYLDCSPVDACSFNRVSGTKTKKDTWITISATPNQDFELLGWYEDDIKISSELSFQYQMKGKDCKIVARFNYNPMNPNDPNSNQTDIDNPEVLLGDANGDNKVDVADIVEVINAIGGHPSANYKAQNAKADGSSEVNNADIDAIVKIIMKK